jgi:hypothetical protein
MSFFRAILIAALIVATPFCASGQFGGMPGGTPGRVPGVGGFDGPPAGPPPACRELLAMRDEVQRHGTAIQKANERRASIQEGCKLFKTFLVAEAKFIRGLEDSSRACGVPGDAIKRAKEGHDKAGQIGKEVCEAAAARGFRPSLPMGDFWWPGDRMPGR